MTPILWRLPGEQVWRERMQCTQELAQSLRDVVTHWRRGVVEPFAVQRRAWKERIAKAGMRSREVRLT